MKLKLVFNSKLKLKTKGEMFVKKRLAILMILGLLSGLALFSVSCQNGEQSGGKASESGEKAAGSDEKLLDYAKHIGFMKGHLRSSVANIEEKGNMKKAHAEHPVKEGYFNMIKGALEEADSDLASELETALKDLPAQADAGDKEKVEAVIELLEKAEAKLIPAKKLEEMAFQGKVISGLLEGIEEEYGEAVTKEGKLKKEEEYQDAYGFFQEAHELYEKIEGKVPTKENQEIEELLDKLKVAFPTVKAPAKLTSVEEVETAVDGITHELAEVAGLPEAEKKEPAEVIAFIREELAEVVEQYEKGEVDEAKATASKMYFEGYEKIEGEIIEKDNDLNTELEPLLGQQFRAKMDAKASADEIKSMADKAGKLLDKAEKIFE